MYFRLIRNISRHENHHYDCFYECLFTLIFSLLTIFCPLHTASFWDNRKKNTECISLTLYHTIGSFINPEMAINNMGKAENAGNHYISIFNDVD